MKYRPTQIIIIQKPTTEVAAALESIYRASAILAESQSPFKYPSADNPYRVLILRTSQSTEQLEFVIQETSSHTSHHNFGFALCYLTQGLREQCRLKGCLLRTASSFTCATRRHCHSGELTQISKLRSHTAVS